MSRAATASAILDSPQNSTTSKTMERPPPYSAGDEPDEQEGFAVQQTTTTITTTTTTSFFPRRKLGSVAPKLVPTTASEADETVGTNVEQPLYQSTTSNLLINKDLPKLPMQENRPRQAQNNRRPKTADAVETRVIQSTIAVTPLALANASLGIYTPQVSKLGLASSVSRTPTELIHAEKPSPLEMSQHWVTGEKIVHTRTSTSVGSRSSVDAAAGLSMSQISPSGSAMPAGSTSPWSPLKSSGSQSSKQKSKTLQSFATSPDGKQTKQLGRRASWWGRRGTRPETPTKGESPQQAASIPMSQEDVTSHSGLSVPRPPQRTASSPLIKSEPDEEDLGQLLGKPILPVFDLTNSPPPDRTTETSKPTSPETPAVSPNTLVSPSVTPSAPDPAALFQSLSRSTSRRPRALSLFLKPSTPNIEVVPSKSPLAPLAPSTLGAHPRTKAIQSPPILRRISSTLFSQSPYPSSSPTPNSSLSVSAVFTEEPSPQPTIPRPNVDEESPEGYVLRLMEAVSKSEVAGVLASSGDDFHIKALQIFLAKFSFERDPLDIAIRRLLMDLSLPRETQQIDRVMEAFAARYAECNPGLFSQPDQAYILAFSLIMLHTDAFNKSNKNKMTKPGYDLLDSLRIDVENLVPSQEPYRYLGTAQSWDHEELRQAFAQACIVELGDREHSRRQSAANMHLAFAGFTNTAPSVVPLTLSTHAGMSPAAFNDVWTFKLTKIGVINRKEDTLDGGKKAATRKWRQFKVALTGSQLLFFRDLRWDHALTEKPGHGNLLTLPHDYSVKPDEVISVNGAVAVLDLSYTKVHLSSNHHPH
ncbi:hypothetical protein FRC19_003325 [Serendipita sp. 401]|nr:hypothetical protein FRC19_003325 [Serendipita sp. 401]